MIHTHEGVNHRTGKLLVHSTEDTSEAWDRFAASAPHATFCHLSAWRGIMVDTLGHETRYLAVVDEATGAWEGVLPLVRMRTPFLGDHIVSVPFLNYGGPIGSPDARRILVGAAEAYARDVGADTLQLRSRGGAAPGHAPLDHKITVLLDLPEDSDSLWKAFPSKLRSQIRRPMKAGFEVRFGLEQVEAFYEVFARNMRDLGTPVHPRRLFHALARRVPGATVAVVYKGERPVAAGFGFTFRDEFEITWASSLREFSREAPNMLLYWSLMEHVIEQGVRTFNFGRCSPDSGTHRFKRQWGSRDVPLPWTLWARDARHAAPSGDGRLFQIATAVWQRLPLGVANTLGPLIAPRLAAF